MMDPHPTAAERFSLLTWTESVLIKFAGDRYLKKGG